MTNYKFYLQQTDRDGNPVAGTLKDLEKDFPGVHYLSCTGLESVGKIKNIYSEDYAEASGVRLHHPSDVGRPVVYEKTTVELSLLFNESNYRELLSEIREYLTAGRVFFWDTARHKKVWLYLEDEQNVEIDNIKENPFITVKFKMNNNWGIGKPCSDDGTLL